ncbi:amidohydrolase [Desulfovibrio sp. OttesenSCG-928-I05]|nr:amidohydrolase [Desulfovibrio sp. OttesenSCG-928-I05]
MTHTTILYTHGPIVTMDPALGTVEAVGVRDGKIIAAGRRDVVRDVLGKGAVVEDLRGQTMVPGFIDGHSHFPSGGMNRLFGADMSVRNVPEALERLAATMRDTRPSEWIVGHSYDEQDTEEKRFLTRHDLDSVTTELPIFMRHITGHTGMTNSRALELADIGPHTPDPSGGIIERDEQGVPTGVLHGIPAQSLVRKLIPGYTWDELRQALESESGVYAGMGITTAQGGPAFSPMDAELGYKVTEFLVEQARQDALPIRMVLFVRANALENLAPYASPVPGTDLSGNGMVTLGAAKLWADGDPRTRTGFFSRPYPPEPGENAPYYGEYLYSVEALTEKILPMHEAGWQVAIHANGDAAVETVLSAFENVRRICPRPTRHLVIHAQYATRAQLARMAGIGVYPCFFITPLWRWDALHARYTGDDMVARFAPCGDAEQLGLPFNLHSDAPITNPSPLGMVSLATTRTSHSGTVRGRDQAISVYSALRAVTANAAFLNYEEHCKGSITPGKYADFTILEKNPLTVDPCEIRSIAVTRTIVGGRTVFTR